jgi:predicted nucleic acid-binding protein
VATIKLLVDTDVLIDFLNKGALSFILDSENFEIYYSLVTKKELLSKRGLRDTERKAILLTLERFRVIPLNQRITETHGRLRRKHGSLEKEDALIAATAISRKLPLLTRNWKHFREIEGLRLFAEVSGEGPRSRDAHARRRRKL